MTNLVVKTATFKGKTTKFTCKTAKFIGKTRNLDVKKIQSYM